MGRGLLLPHWLPQCQVLAVINPCLGSHTGVAQGTQCPEMPSNNDKNIAQCKTACCGGGGRY